jgi:phosphoribosylanthranilate isomerase
MPSGPGVIREDLIAQISASVPPAVASFLLTSKQDAPSIINQQRRCGVSTIQICDRLTRGSYDELREALVGVKLVQVIHVTGEESVREAIEVAPQVDAILLDSGNQSLEIKELGGTGRTHNWTISRKIRDRLDKPLFLAGGLNAANVSQAIREVEPFAIDVCSGVRTDGKLDRAKLSSLFEQVRSIV